MPVVSSEKTQRAPLPYATVVNDTLSTCSLRTAGHRIPRTAAGDFWESLVAPSQDIFRLAYEALFLTAEARFLLSMSALLQDSIEGCRERYLSEVDRFWQGARKQGTSYV